MKCLLRYISMLVYLGVLLHCGVMTKVARDKEELALLAGAVEYTDCTSTVV